MDDLSDDEKFIVGFPIWFPAHPEKLSNGLITIDTSDGRTSAPLFTDMDLAQRFMSSIAGIKQAYVLAALKTPAELLVFMDICESKGIDNVTFDHTRNGARVHPISDLRQAITKPN